MSDQNEPRAIGDKRPLIQKVDRFKERKRSDRTKRIVYFLLGLSVATVWFFPLYWLLKISMVWPIDAVFGQTPSLLITEFSLYNFARVIDMIPFVQYVINSVTITLMAITAAVVFNIFAGYALTLDFFGKNIVTAFLLVILMVPVSITTIPTFLVISELGLINTRLGVAIPFMTIVIGILILRNSFNSIPNSVAEAARVDGASELFIIFGIYCPISKPAIAANIILVGLGAWNSYLWPLVVIADNDLQPLPLALARLQGNMGSVYPILYAFALLVLLPIIVLFLLLQEQFVKSITMSSMKR